MRIVKLNVALIIMSVLVLACGNAVAQNIDTTASATGSIGAFGVPNTATYGQTITIPLGSSNITKFGFRMESVPSTVAFRGEIYAWDSVNNRATGSALYESALAQTTGPTSQIVTFTPGSPVPVTAGQQYVLFVSSARDQTGHAGGGNFAITTSSMYSGGSFVYQNGGADPSAWTTQNWNSVGTDDAGFIAEFDAAPVPTLSQWALIVLGLLLSLFALIQLRRSHPTPA